MDDKGGNMYKPNEQLTKWQSFKRVIWNTETKECLGRTGASWFKIILFYIIFYACLAAFWTCMLVVFYQTLNDNEPKWKLDGSRIGTSPGLGFRPSPPDENIDSTLIWFNTGKNETVNHWVKNLENYLKPYKERSVGDKISSCTGEQTTEGDQVCRVPVLEGANHSCSLERQYSYPEGKPCVLLKLNRIYGWKPENYDTPPDALLKLLSKGYQQDYVYITCTGENAADKDNVGEVEYFPEQGIHFKYFPFANQDVYVSPYVFVRFSNVARSVLVNVECRAWSKNIVFDRGDRLGSVHFELLVD